MEIPVENVEVAETPAETPVEVTPPVVETTEAPAETAPETTDTEEVTEEAPTEEVKAEPEVTAEPVTFDTTAELPELVEATSKVFDKYDLPDEVVAGIEALKAKAAGAPADILGEYSVYGEIEDVKTLLERQSLFTSQREENGNIRPNTDKYAQALNKVAPEKTGWLYYDLAQLPSDKYTGLSKFQEGIADALSMEGDTVNSVMQRYYQTVEAVKSGVNITNDAPKFVPAQLRDAYWSLSKTEREELEMYAPENDQGDGDVEIRNAKLNTLAKIQRGIDSDKREAQANAQAQQVHRQEFHTEVQNTEIKFYNGFREEFTKDVLEKVKFSDDPKMQTILAHQNVALLTQAFDDGAAGESARKALNDAGITFDHAKAAQLLKDVDTATIALVTARRAIDPDTKEPLDKIALNKAVKEYEAVGRKWQAFGQDVLDRQARLVSTGTAEATQKAAEKIKIAAKARPVTKGTPTQAVKEEVVPMRGTPEWSQYWAKKYEADPRYARA